MKWELALTDRLVRALAKALALLAVHDPEKESNPDTPWNLSPYERALEDVNSELHDVIKD